MPPNDSPIGFAPADWVLLILSLVLISGAWLWRPAMQKLMVEIAAHKYACVASFFVLPIALRLLLLPHHPVPTPDIYDEFSHLLLSDTILHGRLANPMHPMHEFFETFFVLQEPTYSSIYPCGMALVLATGRIVSGIPWTGVLFMTGLLCASCYWMLRGWMTPVWSLFGGMLAVMEFGPLCQWTNSYWGGGLAATGGCLVFGALPRLLNYTRRREGVLLGTGLSIHMLSRQFESAFLALVIVLFFAQNLTTFRRNSNLLKSFPWILAPLAATVLLILVQNRAVTKSWATLPEQLSQYQYGVPSALTIEPNPIPHRPLTPQQEMDYRAQTLMHGSQGDSIEKFFLRLEYRVRYYRFFFLPPLYLALFAFFFSWRDRRMWWVALTLAIFAAGTNLFPYLLDHYLAAVTCLYVLVSIVGLQQLCRLRINNTSVGHQIALVVIALCLAEFTGWYGLHLFESPISYPILRYETWDGINHDNPKGRIVVARELAGIPGQILVFVRYSPRHVYQNEWVWNEADIDHSRIVFARDLGDEKNERLIQYYPYRRVLLLDPDGDVPKISAYVNN